MYIVLNSQQNRAEIMCYYSVIIKKGIYNDNQIVIKFLSQKLKLTSEDGIYIYKI